MPPAGLAIQKVRSGATRRDKGIVSPILLSQSGGKRFQGDGTFRGDTLGYSSIRELLKLQRTDDGYATEDGGKCSPNRRDLLCAVVWFCCLKPGDAGIVLGVKSLQ